MKNLAAASCLVLLLLLGSTVTGQVPAGDVRERVLDHRQFLETSIMQAATRPWLRPGDFTIGELKRTEHERFTDAEVEVRFARPGKPLPLSAPFVVALIHNVEASPIWRLRRAGLQRAPGDGSRWTVTSLVFGHRREGPDAKGDFLALPRGGAAMREAVRRIVANERDRCSCRSIELDMSAKKPSVAASIEALGEGYKRRF
ncbi:MAG: hypothetical protein KAI24_22595, partial [Planctomycetes bacterium]|nr:hypothetical protein [Planctomycetota bacterium]